jgi:HD-like signal output (HDOD) protein
MNRKAKTQNGIQEYCRNRVASIISEGLEPLPNCVFDLDVLLSARVVDLKKVTRALRSDIGLSQRVLRLSNAGLIGSGDSTQNISDAVVLLGPCMFHTAVLLCAVTEFGPRELRDKNAEALWSHSVRMAMFSEKIAELSEYPVQGMAYVAGLLHDIGHLPFLMVAREQEARFEGLSPRNWQDNIEVEREIFGLDHCEIGRWMAMTWNFSPSLTDAVEHHHDPSKAEMDSHLAEIVCAAEYFCSTSSPLTNHESAQYTAEDIAKSCDGLKPLQRVRNHPKQAPSSPMAWALRADQETLGDKRFQN